MSVRNLGTALLLLFFFFFLVTCALAAAGQSQEKVIVHLKDPRGDDVGAGALRYPDHGVYLPGLFDLLEFKVSTDEDFVYYDFRFVALTNPFQAPEGYFHQRLEVYIQTGDTPGPTEIKVGQHRLQTNSPQGWNLRLSVSPFEESRLYVAGEEGRLKVFTQEVSSGSLADSNTIRVQVNRHVLPQPDLAWGYYVLVGSFDGLAEDFWRDLGDGPWQLGGAGTPVFDLLAPRHGRRKQEAQLSKGLLDPMYGRKVNMIPWSVGALAVVLTLGVVCLWRWRYGRS